VTCPTGDCVSFGCAAVTCEAGATKCGPLCVDTQSDDNHCGTCPNKCGAGQKCINGNCRLQCPGTSTPCTAPGGTPACVDTSKDDKNCGACNAPCGANQVCVDARCEPRPLVRIAFDGNGTNSGVAPGHNFTVGAGVFVAGKFGQALQGYGSFSGANGLLRTQAKVTIAFWVNTAANLSNAIMDLNNRGAAPYAGVQLGWSGADMPTCVSSSSSPYISLVGGCDPFPAPSLGAWHHFIVRYEGVAVSPGMGGPIEIFIDGALAHKRSNDASNNPIFNQGLPDVFSLGAPGAAFDDLRIYNQVFDAAKQCTLIIGGSWTGSSCTLP
jgi:hypothetical protein